MPRPTEHTLDRDGLTLNFAEVGSGAPLLLLHGLAARWQVFGPVLPALSEQWRALAPDLRGHGVSGRAGGNYRIVDFVDDALALLDERTTEPALVWGHSLGGWIALGMAARRPDAVRALVIGDSAIYPEHLDPDVAVSYLADLPLALRSLAKSLQQLDPDVMSAFRAGGMLDGYDPDLLLPEIACPLLLLQADPDHDGLMSDRDVQRVVEAATHAQHVRFEGTGHGLHVENAQAVLEVVVPFLESCPEKNGSGGPQRRLS